MKATTKKLLCLLAVLVLALSLAVPAAAATQSDIDSWITKNAEAFKAGENLPTTCPICGATNATWTIVDNPTGQTSAMSDGRRTHVYLVGDINFTANASFASAYQAEKMCVYLNGANVTYNSAYQVFTAASKTMNIFGNGNVTNKGNGAMFHYNSDGKINIYGGTYATSGNAAMFTDKVLAEGVTAHVTIYGGTFSVDPKTADDAFEAKDIIAIAKGSTVTSANGKWTVAASGATSNPATADNSALLLWTVLAITSAAALTIASKKRAVK